MQGQKGRPSLYAGIVCENSSLAPPSGTPRRRPLQYSSPQAIPSFLIPHFLTEAISTSVLINVNFFRKHVVIYDNLG